MHKLEHAEMEHGDHETYKKSHEHQYIRQFSRSE